MPYELWTKVCCSWSLRLSSPHPWWVLGGLADERQPCGVRALKQGEMPEQCKTYWNYGEAKGRERIWSKSITRNSQRVNKSRKTTTVLYRLIVLKSLTGPLLSEEDACTQSLLLPVSSSHSQLLREEKKSKCFAQYIQPENLSVFWKCKNTIEISQKDSRFKCQYHVSLQITWPCESSWDCVEPPRSAVLGSVQNSLQKSYKKATDV